MQFGCALINRRASDLDAFFDRVSVSTFLPGTLIEPTELAIRNADIRVIKVPIDVVVRRQAVLAAANGVS